MKKKKKNKLKKQNFLQKKQKTLLWKQKFKQNSENKQGNFNRYLRLLKKILSLSRNYQMIPEAPYAWLFFDKLSKSFNIKIKYFINNSDHLS